MSWSVNRLGIKSVVLARVNEELDRAAATYAGTPEADDVAAAKAMIAAALAPCGDDEGVKVEANGSRGNGYLSVHVTAARYALDLR